MPKFTIIGGGLVGSLLSIYLRKKNVKVNVFEKRADIRYFEEKGRSINMALSDRGWKALEAVGLVAQVKPYAIPMYGRMIHNLDGTSNFQAYGKENQAIYSISRNKLTQILVEESISIGTQFEFDLKCIDIDLKKKELVLQHHQSQELHKHLYDVVVGTDGAFSETRSVLTKTERFNYHQWYLEHGYKELHIPADKDGKHRLEKESLHIWPRGSHMLIALPNIDGSFTCTLFLHFEGENSFANINDSKSLLEFFNKNFPDVVELMPNLISDYFHNPSASLINVQCWPWSYQDSVLLMGDAAHSIVPFYGQGMNAGFEDVRTFGALMEQPFESWTTLFKTFEEARKPNADAISQMALDNFLEMRDKVADQRFLLKKKIDALLHEIYGDKWLPQYTMVTFSPDISYREAYEKGLRQSEILEEILNIPSIEENWKKMDYSNYLP